MAIKERLFEFLAAKDLKPSVFERKCGLSNGFCSKVKNNITDGPLSLIKNAFPELNIEWLKSGVGVMMEDEHILEIPKSEDNNSHMLALVRMMQEFIDLGKKNADANLINAEANKLNAQNLERLITLIENKYD